MKQNGVLRREEERDHWSSNSLYQNRLEPAGQDSSGNTRWTVHGIRFHRLPHRARAPSRTDLQGKLNKQSRWYCFPHLPLDLAIAVQFVFPHTCHWGCIFPTAVTEVTDLGEGFTDPLWFVQFAELSAGRWAGLSQITRCFISVKAQAPDTFWLPGSNRAQCGAVAEQ